MLSLKEAAKRLGVTERTITNYILRGQLKGVALGSSGRGRRWRVEPEELERFIESLKVTGDSNDKAGQ